MLSVDLSLRDSQHLIEMKFKPIKIPKLRLPRLESFKVPKIVNPEEFGVLGPLTQECIRCGGSWRYDANEGLIERCPHCSKWLVGFFRRRIVQRILFSPIVVALGAALAAAVGYWTVKLLGGP